MHFILKVLRFLKKIYRQLLNLSGVLDAPDDYLPLEMRNDFNAIVPEPEKIKSHEFVQKFLVLKERYHNINF